MTSQNILIDNLTFAARGERLQAKLPITDLPRLYELIEPQQSKPTDNLKSAVAHPGEIAFTLIGERNALGQSLLHLSLKAELTTICQRCLSEMPLVLALDFHYLISNIDDDAMEELEAEIGDEFDIQEISQAMDVKLLIEDELILAMPIAPMHKSDCAPATMQSGEKPNPFAVLKGLIKS